MRTRIRFAMLRTTSLFVGTEERRSTSNMRPLYRKSRTTSSMRWWWSRWYVLKICVYIFDCLKFNGPFPLPMNCALPNAPLDLIVCIYCLNDLFAFRLCFTLLRSTLFGVSEENHFKETHVRFFVIGCIRFYFICILKRGLKKTTQVMTH